MLFLQEQVDIKLSVLGLVKALHAMTVVPTLTTLVGAAVSTVHELLHGTKSPPQKKLDCKTKCLFVARASGNWHEMTPVLDGAQWWRSHSRFLFGASVAPVAGKAVAWDF